MNETLKEISEAMIARYSSRYQEMGYDVRTLGWGNNDQQKHRFLNAIDGISIKPQSTILDIGCGFGDLLKTITKFGFLPESYIGWDINPDLINEAKIRWAKSTTKTAFEVVDLTSKLNRDSVADLGFMLGVLNLNFGDSYNNYDYSKSIISKAFKCINKVLVIDFLSSHITANYPKEDFVFYHDPTIMLEFAFTLTPNVVLKHNYAPIPQKEFMLYLYK